MPTPLNPKPKPVSESSAKKVVPRRGNRNSTRVWGAILYIGLCFIVLAFSTLAGWLYSSSTIASVGLTYLIHPPTPQIRFNQNTMNVLVLGCDVDETVGGEKVTKNGARSDTILLVHFDFPNKKITGITIPRDVLLKIPGMPIHKMNAFHEFGGDQLASEAVEYLLPGVHIDRTVAINFDGFVTMVNAVGGVPFYVPKDMNWDDNAGHLHIHLKKGMQILDGTHAEELVRFRHSDSDLMRQERQHAFILAFQEQLKRNPQALTSVLDATVKMLSDGFDAKDTISLGAWVAGVKGTNIKLGMLPTRADGFALRPDENKIRNVLIKYDLLDASSETTLATVYPHRVHQS